MGRLAVGLLVVVAALGCARPKQNGFSLSDDEDKDKPQIDGGIPDGAVIVDGQVIPPGCKPNDKVLLYYNDAGTVVGCVAQGRDKDVDCDGFTEEQGDCDDCSPTTNPGALDVPDSGADEDCSGKKDDWSPECDGELAFDSDDAMDGARAIGLCEKAKGDGWGVLSAKYVKANGEDDPNPIGHGIVAGFGDRLTPRQGDTMLLLSSGTARSPGMPGHFEPVGFDQQTQGRTPGVYPIDFPSCKVNTQNDKTANDPMALEIELKVPTNASGIRFKFNFFTYEYPDYICSIFNDYFVVLQDPTPEQALHGNISFDAKDNPISVNAGFLEVCEPQATFTGQVFDCLQGTEQLEGTGFEPGGATGWLESQSPVEPGSVVTFRFAIWDQGDHILDSLVVLDDFEFLLEEVKMPRTIRVPDSPD